MAQSHDTMSEHFCTSFDHRYVAKGLAMWRSLKAHRPDAVLHVLCMDELCEAVLSGLDLQDVHLHRLAAVEEADPDLLRTKGTRSRTEYYFTITPCFPRHLLRSGLAAARLTYVDADLFFMADPQAIFDDIGSRSIGLIEHRFAPALADRLVYGRFNVGWITFGNDAVGRACLDAWRTACLDWCYDRLEDGRFADQKYLDAWPEQFASVAIVAHPGANLAPWNLGRHSLTASNGQPQADGLPVLFFHAHGFQLTGTTEGHRINLADYAATTTPVLEDAILSPYERLLRACVDTLAVPLLLEMNTGRRRERSYEQETLREYRAARSYVATLEARLGDVTTEQRTAADALDAVRTASTIERAVAGAEHEALTRRVAELDVALAAQRAELLAETFKVGALTTAAAADREARSMAEQQWAATREESHALSSRLSALEARLDMEATSRVALDARLAAADSARDALNTALAASRAEYQGLVATLAGERDARAARDTALTALTAEKDAAVAALAASRADAQALAATLEQVRQTLAARDAAGEALLADKEAAVAALAASRAEYQGLAATLAGEREVREARDAEHRALSAEKEAAVTGLAASRADSQAMAAIAERERAGRLSVEGALAAALAEKTEALTAAAAARAEADTRAAMLVELQGTIARLAADLESAGQRVGALTSQLNREERARMDASRDAEAARAQLAASQSDRTAREHEARATVERLTRDLTQLTAQLEEARTNWYHADGNLKVLKGSLSWKVTGPLRVVRDAIIGPAQHG